MRTRFCCASCEKKFWRHPPWENTSTLDKQEARVRITDRSERIKSAEISFNLTVDLTKKIVENDGSITIGNENAPFCINGNFLNRLLFGKKVRNHLLEKARK